MAPCSWELLPAEIRLTIMEKLFLIARTNKIHSCYASVSKEWQEFFEKWNFRYLTVTQHCLVDLSKMVRHQRKFVNHICLFILLGTYGSRRSAEPETPKRIYHNEEITRKGIWKLFSVLSTWGRDGDWSNKGLTLELSICSYSDFKHRFKDYCFEDDVNSEPIHEPSDSHDPPTSMSILRLFGPNIDLRLKRDLPKVDVVTSFLVRRQTRRQLDSQALSQIFMSLPKLENARLELWRKFSKTIQDGDDIGYKSILESRLPRSLKRLTLFEDFNEDLNATFPERNAAYCRFIRIPSASVGTALAKASLSLEQLSVSFLVDAKDFFQAYQSDWIWKDLASLALTSRLLDSTKDPADISNLLHAAGVAARNMPKLQTMEIWNGGRRHACVFRYHVTDGFATITWDSVWDLRLESWVIEAWEAVALEHSGQILCVDVHQIPGENIQSHGNAIDHLKLKQQTLRPTSLHQIRLEGRKSYNNL